MTVTLELRELIDAGQFRDALSRYRSQRQQATTEDVLLAATAAGHLGELDLGVSLAAEAHGSCVTQADLSGRMRAAHLLGGFAFERGRLGDAEAYFSEASRLAQRSRNDLQAAKSANNLASVAHLGGRSADAVRLYQHALAAYLRLGDDAGAAETGHNLALLHREAGHFCAAAEAVETALVHARRTSDRGLIALILSGRAELAMEREDLDTAATALAEARPHAESGGDAPALAELHRLQGRLALTRGNLESAYEFGLMAWAAAGVQGNILLEGECAAVCALSLKRLGRIAEGHGFFLRAQQRLVALGSAIRAQRLAREWASG
ncbi:MAG: tetratricopeptide repeat protein [Gemmatimonadota bacterium]